MMYVDLDELPHLLDDHFGWRLNKPAMASFYRKDHYGDAGSELSESIRELVYARTGNTVEGPIRLLTHFRYFGHVFNPVSIYYCYDKSGEQVTNVVAEVTNTPWKEQYCYVLPGKTHDKKFITHPHPKKFHVSPFMNMNMNYQWDIKLPDEHLDLSIKSIAQNSKLFEASVHLERTEMNSKNLAAVLINYPLMTLKVISAIHIQALRLWLKGIAYVPHPKNNI